MTGLIIFFVRNSTKASITKYLLAGRQANLYKEMLVLVLFILILVDEFLSGFEESSSAVCRGRLGVDALTKAPRQHTAGAPVTSSHVGKKRRDRPRVPPHGVNAG
jgi:hypothetical protein